MYRSIVTAVLSLTLIIGCSSTVTSIKNDVDIPLSNTKGYALFSVETNLGLKSIHISGEESISLTYQDLRTGTNYFLIDLEGGKYSFDKIRMQYRIRTTLKDGYWDFEVNPNTISYVGHLKVVRPNIFSGVSNVELENRSSEALAYMEKSFPNILNNRKMTYEGPGEDPFIQFAQSL